MAFELPKEKWNLPASPRQTFALFRATGKDYRGQGLTMKQASDLLADANKGKSFDYEKHRAEKKAQAQAKKAAEIAS